MLPRLRIVVAALAALPLALSVTPAAAQRGAVRDWSQLVAATPEGGYRMGNPNAPLKLVEYMSLTCPHCAHFSAVGYPVLVRDYVRTGRLSYELRNFVRDPFDIAAAMVSRCASPAAYFRLTGAILASQQAWTGRVSDGQVQGMQQLSPLARVQRLADLTGLIPLAARYGVSPAAEHTCLSSQARLNAVVQLRQRADQQYQVPGTPSFVLNGRLVPNVFGWEDLQPVLRAAH